MAKKATSPASEELVDSSNEELDQAIDDLRGVLKADESGEVPQMSDLGGESDFGTDFPAAGGMDLDSDFGGGNSDIGGGDFGTSDFGGSDLTTTDFGGSDDFGGGDFGGGDFGGADLGGSDFGASSAPSAAQSHPGSALTANMDLIMNIPIDVQIILGGSRMQVSTLMNLTEGATIALDRKIGEPVDLMVNGRLIGRGEITVLENDETRFGIRLTEVTTATNAK